MRSFTLSARSSSCSAIARVRAFRDPRVETREALTSSRPRTTIYTREAAGSQQSTSTWPQLALLTTIARHAQSRCSRGAEPRAATCDSDARAGQREGERSSPKLVNTEFDGAAQDYAPHKEGEIKAATHSSAAEDVSIATPDESAHEQVRELVDEHPEAPLKDLGWNMNTRETHEQPTLIKGMDNDELFMLIRRYNYVRPRILRTSVAVHSRVESFSKSSMCARSQNHLQAHSARSSRTAASVALLTLKQTCTSRTRRSSALTSYAPMSSAST